MNGLVTDVLLQRIGRARRRVRLAALACAWWTCALGPLGAQAAPGQVDSRVPRPDAADEALFLLVEEQRGAGLSVAQQRRWAFWDHYHNNVTYLLRRHCGALVAEDFEGGIEPERREVVMDDGREVTETFLGDWRIWQSDPGLDIDVAEGQLSIRGRTTLTHGKNYNGVVGVQFGNTDVVVLTDFFPGPLGASASDAGARSSSTQSRKQVAMLHLCGGEPDYFHELSYGLQADGRRGWRHEVEGPRAPVWGDELVARADERPAAVEVLGLEHGAADDWGRAWRGPASRRIPVGGRQSVLLSIAKVELKVDVRAAGVLVDTRFDNCRVYPRPENHPLRLLLYPAPATPDVSVADLELLLQLGPRSRQPDGAGSGPLGGPPVGAGEGPGGPVLRSATDALGRAWFALPPELDYPASARLTVSSGSGPPLHFDIVARGVEGVYPDDAWVLRINANALAGRPGWWAALDAETRLEP